MIRTVLLSFVALGCAGPAAAPSPASVVPPGMVAVEEPLLRELCPDVTARAPGDYESVVDLYGRFGHTADLEARRVVLCDPGTTHRAFAHGAYGQASRIFETEPTRGLALMEALAREYAEPQALGDLALARLGGAGGTTIDVPSAFCDAHAALAISNSIAATDHDRSFHTNLVGLLMQFVTVPPETLGAPAGTTMDSVMACAATRIGPWERHFGHVMSDHEINEAAFERARAAEPPLDEWQACPCEQLVETADGRACPMAWTSDPTAELCVTFRTHGPASADVALVLEVRRAGDESSPPIATREIPATEGRTETARALVVRVPRDRAQTRVTISTPDGELLEVIDAM